MMNDETARLRSLHDLNLLDTPPEPEFDEIVELASQICGTSISLVSLVDGDRQWFKAALGFPEISTPRSISFCSHAIQQADLFLVEDAQNDRRFQHNPLVTGHYGVRFYAGMPLQAPDGAAIGTLCVLDTVPRTLSASQCRALDILGRQVEARVALRAKQKALGAALLENERLAAEAQKSSGLFRAFMNHGPFLGYIKDSEGRYVFHNQKICDQFGIADEEWLGKSDTDLFTPEIAEHYRSHDRMVLAGDAAIEFDEVTPEPDGSFLHWHSYKFPFRQPDGELMLAGLSVDITQEIARSAELERSLREKQELAENLEASHTLFHAFADLSPHLSYLKDDQGRYVFYNRLYSEHFGISQTEWIGKTSYDVLPVEIAQRAQRVDAALLESGEPLESQDQTLSRTGQIIHYRSLKFTYRGANGKRMIAGIAIDITEQILRERALTEANQKLDQLATTDALTGLANRRAFEARIAIDFSNSVRRKRSLTLLLMDVDNFKLRNDELGHAAGDLALQELGRILLKSGRAGDLPTRLGGEEFAFLLPDTDTAGALVIARRVQTFLREGPISGRLLTVSIGIVQLDETMQSWERMLACADDAMYEAKRSGKDCVVIHQEHVSKLLLGLNRPQPDPAQTTPAPPQPAILAAPSEFVIERRPHPVLRRQTPRKRRRLRVRR